MYQKLKKLLKNSNRISSDHSYESELETLEIRIKVLVDEMTESKRTLHNIERKLKDKKTVIDVLAKEEEEAKKKFNKIQEELRLVRSEERRVGKECLRLCRARWAPEH